MGAAPATPNPPPASPWIAYTGPIQIGGDQTQWVITAVATMSGMGNSQTATSAVYSVNLAVPTISAVPTATATDLTVSWGTVTSATGYNVLRDTSASGSFTTEVAVSLDSTATSYTDSGLSIGTTYYYKVQANYAGGPTLLYRSLPVAGTTLPATPTGLTVTNPTPTSLSITWNASFGATSYQLYRATSASGPFTSVVYSGSSTTYVDATAALGSTYYYEVQTTDAGGNSGLSAPATGTTASVYAGGWSIGSNLFKAGYWKNGTWNALANPAGSYSAQVNSLVVSGSDVYAGGFCLSSSTVIAGYWKNGTWNALANPYGSYPAYVSSLAVSGADVYAGGHSENTDSLWGWSVAGYWKNGAWNALPNTYGSYGAAVASLVVSGSAVYAGGNSMNNTSMVAGYWVNGIWFAPSFPCGSVGCYVVSLVVSSSGVYAGVDISSNVLGFNSGYSENGTWNALVNPYGSGTVSIDSLAVSGSDVYAGGSAPSGSGASYMSNAGYWKNGTWNVLTNPYGSYAADVAALVVVGSGVYAGGIVHSGTTSFAGYWDNGNWVALSNPLAGAVSSLVVQ